VDTAALFLLGARLSLLVRFFFLRRAFCFGWAARLAQLLVHFSFEAGLLFRWAVRLLFLLCSCFCWAALLVLGGRLVFCFCWDFCLNWAGLLVLSLRLSFLFFNWAASPDFYCVEAAHDSLLVSWPGFLFW
jgi:hypothetical protein